MLVVATHIVTFATLTEVVSRSAGTTVVITGTLAGCSRAIAVLRRFPADRVEWMTAVGFTGGVLATLLLVCVDKTFLGG
jgi:malonyl CoA-acyl carrier protein transacylase